MAKKTLTNPHGLPTIYGKRQPKRPHYLRELMERRHIESQAELVRELGADKSLVSRWLDEDDPATPGVEWQHKLGVFFGDEENPVDIFQHPDHDWFYRLVRNNSQDKIEQAKRVLKEIGITPEGEQKKATGRQ